MADAAYDGDGVDEIDILKDWMEPVMFSRKNVSQFRNLARDFSDGVCAAEVINHYVPSLIEMHNYNPASSAHQKTANWKTLNTKVLSKIGLTIPKAIIDKVVNYSPGGIEMVLSNIKIKVDQHLNPKHADSSKHRSTTHGDIAGTKKKRGTSGRAAGAEATQSTQSSKNVSSMASRHVRRSDSTLRSGRKSISSTKDELSKVEPPINEDDLSADGSGADGGSQRSSSGVLPSTGKREVSPVKHQGRPRRVAPRAKNARAHPLGSRSESDHSDVVSTDAKESIYAESIAERDRLIENYEEVVGIFQSKVKKLEALIKLKDHRIEQLLRKCKENGIKV